jgi:hypothetical protein
MAVAGRRAAPGKISPPVVILAIVMLANWPAGCVGQQQIVSRSGGGATLIVSDNPNGNSANFADRAPASNRRLTASADINGNGLEVNGNEPTPTDQEEQVVAGLLEWLKKKKREKEEKKNQQKQPIILPVPIQPQPQPVYPIHPPQQHDKKVIHIHINNHIKKEPHKKKHQQHHKKHHGGYEYYHDGDYHDHDKYYMGKFHAPLLSHHFYSFDHYDYGGHYDDGHHHYGGHEHGGGHYGGGEHGGGHYGGDHHAGYESRPEPQIAAGGSQDAGQQQQAAASRPKQTNERHAGA